MLPLETPDRSHARARPETRTKNNRPQTLLWQRIMLGVLIGTTKIVCRLSRPAAMRLGTRLGGLAFCVAGRARRSALRNLRLAYGDALSPAQRDALTRRVFEQFGKTVIDFLGASRLSEAQTNDLVAQVDGWEWMEATRAGARGFIIVTGHVGNFELLGRWLANQGVPSTAVARDPDDPHLAAYARQMRQHKGNVILSKGTSARELLARLSRGEVITLGVDQNSGDAFVPFLNVPAGTVTGPAKLALHTGAPLLPAFCLREPDDRYRMLFLPPIVAQKTGDREADVIRVTTQINQALEKVVRAHPDQWLWLHNRWKSAFEEKNRARWPQEHDFEAAHARWRTT